MNRSTRIGPSRPPSIGLKDDEDVVAGVVEREYIYNLKQQVYFLEMQEKMLREKLTEKGPKMKSRGVDAEMSAGSPELMQASLHEQLGAIEKEYGKKKLEYGKLIVESKSAAASDMKEASKIKILLNSTNEELNKQPARRANQQKRFEYEMAREKNITIELAESIDELRQELSAADIVLKESNDRYDRAQERLSMANLQVNTLERELIDSQRGALSAFVNDGRKKRIEELIVNASNLRKEQETKRLRAEKLTKEVVEKKKERFELEAQNIFNESEIMKLKQIAILHETTNNNLRGQVDKLREQHESEAHELDDLTTKYNEAEVKVRNMSGEATTTLEVAKLRHKTAKDIRDELKETLEKVRTEISTLEEECARLEKTKENAINDEESKTNEREQIRNRLVTTKSEVDKTNYCIERGEIRGKELEEERHTLSVLKDKKDANVRVLENELTLRKQFGEIGKGDIEKLRETNSKLTSVIESLGLGCDVLKDEATNLVEKGGDVAPHTELTEVVVRNTSSRSPTK